MLLFMTHLFWFFYFLLDSQLILLYSLPQGIQISSKMSPEGKKLLNIVVLGFGFMFMFTAFQTCGNIEVGRIYWCLFWINETKLRD